MTVSPCLSGIYQIRCISNGKIYVGSAVNLQARWGQHRRKLKHGKHHNIHLQHAWNKYGEANFEFSVLEYVTTLDLLPTEQAWIEATRCTDRSIGFNIFPTAGSPSDAFVQVWEGFVDPAGHEVTITNLFDFCRQYDLDWASMHRLARGKSKLKSYKGWTHKNSVRKRDYIKSYSGFIAPDGHPAGLITNLASFCRELGLDKTHMVAVAHGRICSHHGWTYMDGKQNKNLTRAYTNFVSPEGQKVLITNIQAFCREHRLSPVHMYKLKSGKQKSHKGWIWSEDDE